MGQTADRQGHALRTSIFEWDPRHEQAYATVVTFRYLASLLHHTSFM